MQARNAIMVAQLDICQLRIQVLIGRARMLTQLSLDLSNASYRDAQQIEMLHTYLHRITYKNFNSSTF